MHRRVLGIDAAYTDVFIEPPANIRQQLTRMDGDRPVFNTAPLEHIAGLFKMYPGAVTPGGTIMNTVSQIAALGGKVSFLHALGQDSFGTAIHDNMVARNIDEVVLPAAGLKSPVMYCLKDGEETLYRRDDGDGLSMTGAEIPDEVAQGQPIIALQMRRLLQIRPELRDKIDQMRFRHGAKLALGMQHMHRSTVDENPGLLEIFEQADYVFGNRAEYEAMLHTRDPWAALHHASKDAVEDGFNPTYIMTNGKHPIIVVQGGKIVATHQPAPVDAVCTVGAGDAIMGGMLYALSRTDRDWPIDKALQLGALCAENILGIVGGQPQPKTPGHLQYLADQVLAA